MARKRTKISWIIVAFLIVIIISNLGHNFKQGWPFKNIREGVTTTSTTSNARDYAETAVKKAQEAKVSAASALLILGGLVTNNIPVATPASSTISPSAF